MTMIPPRIRIPSSEKPGERYGAVAVSLLFHLTLILLMLWKGMPVESELLAGDLGGGGGGGNNGEQTTLISFASPPEAPPVPVPTPPVTPDPIPQPTPDPVPPPPKDTVKTPPAPTPAPTPAPVATTGSTGTGDPGVGSAGSGGGAGGGTGGGIGPGTGSGQGPGSGGGGGGGNAVDGIIPPSPTALYLPPPAPKSVQGKTVIIDLTVDAFGKVLDAQLKQSTGNSKYDDSLKKTALGWRFRPARNRAGEAVKATVPVTYVL